MTKSDLILKELDKLFPNPKCELVFNNNFELIVAVVLSAQCTDKRVNQTTPKLFEKFPTPQDLANAKLEEVMEIIKPCGFYNVKSKNIINLSKDLIKKHNGVVPNNFNDLISLAGVGRKTANVVLAVGFNQDTLAVDTHVFRVSNRLGITSKAPLECEEKLKKMFKKKDWSRLHHLLILFGRYDCKAINPKCEHCKLQGVCKYYKSNFASIK